MTSLAPQILLTGATGYIGGTILSTILSCPHSTLKSTPITLLLRSSSRAKSLTSTYGSRVHPITYKDLDDLDATTAAAANADLVINTTPGFHLPSAEALIRGLAQRKKNTGKEVWYIQTSGTSNLADRPISKIYLEDHAGREFDDKLDDVFAYEVSRQTNHQYSQRTTELGVINLGLELGVKTLVIMSPLIFGLGSGLFNKISIQIPTLIRGALDHGRAVVVGDGEGVWDHVHVQDLADLYTLFVLRILDGGEGVPTGKRGIVFSANGRHTWKEVAERVGRAMAEQHLIESAEVENVSLQDGARILNSMMGGGVDEMMVELSLVSNSRTVSSVGRSLGWMPSRDMEAFERGFAEDMRAVLEERK